MSWVSDFLENPQKSIDNALGTNFSGQGGGFLSSGDIAKVIGNQAKALKNVYSAPIEAGLDIAKGDTKSAGSRFVKSGTSLGYIAGGPFVDMWASQGGQKFLRDTKIGANFAGYNAGLVQGRDTGTVSNQYRDEAIRFGAEAAVIGGGIYAYNNPAIPTFSEAGYVSGKELVAGFSNPFTTSNLLGASAIKGLTGQNPGKEFVKEILGNDLADIIFPSNPSNPVTSDPSNPEEFGPWNSQVTSGVNPVMAKQGTSSNIATILLVISGVLVTYLIIKKVS